MSMIRRVIRPELSNSGPGPKCDKKGRIWENIFPLDRL